MPTRPLMMSTAAVDETSGEILLGPRLMSPESPGISDINNCLEWAIQRALETQDDLMMISPSASTINKMNHRRHISKSTSELSGSPSREEIPDPENRPSSAAAPLYGSHHHHHSHQSVYQKASSFFAQLKSRWGHHHHHGKRSERRHKSPGRSRQDSTDYAADYSSEHSTPSSTQSPRHRPLAYATGNKAGIIQMTTGSPSTPRRAHTITSVGGETNSPGGSPKPGVHSSTQGTLTGLDLLPLNTTDEITRRREAQLRQYAFFQLRIHLRKGQGLISMDKNGLSDPYVKFKCGGRLVYKSRTIYRDLNPVWDESFTVPIEDPFVSMVIKVFDYDWGLQDDFMGSTSIDLTTLDLSRPTELTLTLQDPARPDTYLGELYITATLYPKSQEDKEQAPLHRVCSVANSVSRRVNIFNVTAADIKKIDLTGATQG